MGVDKLDSCKRLLSYASQLRKSSGITTKQVAERTGVKPPYISRLESGKVSPTLSSFISYADGIGYEVELVKKGDKHDYRRLSEALIQALDTGDKKATVQAITELKTKLYQDKIAESADCDLLLGLNGSDIPVVLETTDSAKQEKSVKAYGKKLKCGK